MLCCPPCNSFIIFSNSNISIKMYHMKTIVPIENNITLPQCMYYLKNPNNNLKIDEPEINISHQVKRFLKEAPKDTMIELEQRQGQLLQKLDALYEKIKAISSSCTLDLSSNVEALKVKSISNSKDIVIILNPDVLPHFLNIFLKTKHGLNITWHIHSSVPSDKTSKIKDFFKSKQELYNSVFDAEINIRLIFKCVSAELRISSLEVPILGVVNVLRYLCLLYPNVILYKQHNFYTDSLLDQCHILEKTTEKQKEEIISKLFSKVKNWIYEDDLSVIDLAAFVIIKWQNIRKSVPINWYKKCENMFL